MTYNEIRERMRLFQERQFVGGVADGNIFAAQAQFEGTFPADLVEYLRNLALAMSVPRSSLTWAAPSILMSCTWQRTCESHRRMGRFHDPWSLCVMTGSAVTTASTFWHPPTRSHRS